jgi:hypothetical protein
VIQESGIRRDSVRDLLLNRNLRLKEEPAGETDRKISGSPEAFMKKYGLKPKA